MGVTDPSTKMLPVSLQLCHISSSSTGLFPSAEWDKVVDLGIYSPGVPLRWVGAMSCMSVKWSHLCGPADRQGHFSLASLLGEAAGKQAHPLPIWGNPDKESALVSQHGSWGTRVAGNSGEVRLQPAPFLMKLLTSLVSSGLLSCWRITWVNWKGKTQKGPSIWDPASAWEENASAFVLVIGFQPGKNSKWAGHLGHQRSSSVPRARYRLHAQRGSASLPGSHLLQVGVGIPSSPWICFSLRAALKARVAGTEQEITFP